MGKHKQMTLWILPVLFCIILVPRSTVSKNSLMCIMFVWNVYIVKRNSRVIISIEIIDHGGYYINRFS